jgi:hypothetical protein
MTLADFLEALPEALGDPLRTGRIKNPLDILKAVVNAHTGSGIQ